MKKYILLAVLTVCLFIPSFSQKSSFILSGDIHYDLLTDHDMDWLKTRPGVKAIVQAGDISEGLAGTPEKARQMASNTMNAIDETNINVPWINAKGNHDVTGPGSADAFNEFYIPMFRKQTGSNKIVNASYSYRFDNVQITCIDPWDKEIDMDDFLDKELSSSDS